MNDKKIPAKKPSLDMVTIKRLLSYFRNYRVSMVFVFLCIILSTAASVVLCSFLNTQLASGIGASLFVFGVFSFAILVIVALLTAIISTFLPVYNAAKKKPVDSIRSL